jgi:hypothetical protein
LRRNTVLAVLTLSSVLLISLLAACGAQGEPAGTETLDGQALAEERCTECHPITRVTEAKKARDGWQVTVERMVANGARLSEAEQQAVIEHLAKAYPAQ